MFLTNLTPQIFLTTADQPCSNVSHVTGAAQILKGRGFTGPKDDFERLLLATLRGPVVSTTQTCKSHQLRVPPVGDRSIL